VEVVGIGVLDVVTAGEVEVGVDWDAVVVAVVALLQPVKITAVTSSNEVTTTSHFLLSLLNNFLFSFFSYYFYYKRPSLREV